MRQPGNFNKSRTVLLVALLFTALGAGSFRTPSILFMAAVLCGAPLVGSLVGRFSARGLHLIRQFPTVGMVGDVVVSRLTLSNHGPWPAFLVHCRPLEQKVQIIKSARKPKSGDRRVALECIDQHEHIEPVLGVRAQVCWEEKWHLRRRGHHELVGAGAGVCDPLGIYRKLTALSPSQEIVILPRPLKIGRLGWHGGTAGGMRSPQQAARVADAADFHGIRPHHPGEGLRRIHWKSTARTGSLHVIEWQEEMACDLTLFLDVQSSVHAGHGDEHSLEVLVVMAATIANFLLQSGHRFGMMWWAETPDTSPQSGLGNASMLRLHRYEARNVGGIDAILRALAELQECFHDDATLAHLVSQGAPFVPHGQGSLLISTERGEAQLNSAHLGTPTSRRAFFSQTLLIEAASFETQGESSNRATEPPSAQSNGLSPLLDRGVKTAFSAGGRPLIRRGDSLISILERGA
ncbi:MAG TPA: DUF58 domain-containing protein [Abditibacterium sp.]|jgi:hypothetical protein